MEASKTIDNALAEIHPETIIVSIDIDEHEAGLGARCALSGELLIDPDDPTTWDRTVSAVCVRVMNPDLEVPDFLDDEWIIVSPDIADELTRRQGELLAERAERKPNASAALSVLVNTQNQFTDADDPIIRENVNIAVGLLQGA